MTTQQEIDLIIKTQYNNFEGEIMQKLKAIHDVARRISTDKEYLEFLKNSVNENRKPIYKIPKEIADIINETKHP